MHYRDKIIITSITIFLSSCAPSQQSARLTNLQEIVADPKDTFVALQVPSERGVLVPIFCSAQFDVEYKLTSNPKTSCFFLMERNR